MVLEDAGYMPRYRGVRDALLLAAALPLARRAQKVGDTPLPELVVGLAGRGLSRRFAALAGTRRRAAAGSHRAERPGSADHRVDSARIARAAERAVARWARWFGGLDSCLTRSLVTGALLARSGEAVLHVGFRPGQDERAVDGHAWVTLDGEPVGRDARLAGEPYAGALEIAFVSGENGP